MKVYSASKMRNKSMEFRKDVAKGPVLVTYSVANFDGPVLETISIKKSTFNKMAKALVDAGIDLPKGVGVVE